MRLKLLPLLILSSFGVPTLAADGLYLGIQAGIMSNDRPGFDDSSNLGITLGYEFLNVALGDIAIEGGYTGSVDRGSAPAGDWELETLAAYGVFRSAGPLYIKAKAGALNSDIKTAAGSDRKTDFSAGLGAGVSVGIAQLEVEYTRIEENVDFISLTVTFMTPF